MLHSSKQAVVLQVETYHCEPTGSVPSVTYVALKNCLRPPRPPQRNADCPTKSSGVSLKQSSVSSRSNGQRRYEYPCWVFIVGNTTATQSVPSFGENKMNEPRHSRTQQKGGSVAKEKKRTDPAMICLQRPRDLVVAPSFPCHPRRSVREF